MSRHTFPDGPDTVIEYAPDGLGEVPPAAAVDVLHKAIDRLHETRASFVPAIHDVRRDSLIAAAVRWRKEGDYYAAQIAQQQLADAIDRYLGVA
jgi:hypothetical protein